MSYLNSIINDSKKFDSPFVHWELNKPLTDEQIKLSRGDIIPPSLFCNFVVEAKNYAEFPFHQLVKKNKIVLLDTWIDQVETDSNDKDLWLLFIKITRKGTYVLYDTNKLPSLKYGVKYKRFWFCDMQYFFQHYKNISSSTTPK